MSIFLYFLLLVIIAHIYIVHTSRYQPTSGIMSRLFHFEISNESKKNNERGNEEGDKLTHSRYGHQGGVGWSLDGVAEPERTQLGCVAEN